MIQVCLSFLLIVLPYKHESAEPITIKPIKVIELKKEIELKLDVFDTSMYKEQIGQRESGNRYDITNTRGCLGKYQFEVSTLRYLGFTKEEIKVFINQPHLQEKAMELLIKENYRQLNKKGLLSYSNKIIKGDTITIEGMLAASHLLGTEAVKDYLITNGSMREYTKTLKSGRKVKIRKSDGYGTSIKEYLTLIKRERYP